MKLHYASTVMLFGGSALLLHSHSSSSHVAAFDYEVDPDAVGSISLMDLETEIDGIKTIFRDDEVAVSVTDIGWKEPETPIDGGGSSTLFWTTAVDGVEKESGEVDLTDVKREMPTSFDAGKIKATDSGSVTITVTMTLDGNEQSTSRKVEVYGRGVSVIPLLLILFLAMGTRMVELSLFIGIFTGACMVAGNIKDGFKTTLDTFILEALTDANHVFVILFTIFLSGLVGMMQKSGGMMGFTRDVSKFATSPRSGQFACFLVGIFIFFDDYANVLLAGETMRPLLDMLCTSREKLAFIVDATSAPIASISPISSWVGFEVDLIQTEIDKIIEKHGDDIGIKTSGFGVFLQSIKFRYYPIFMLTMVMLLIFSGRDFGPMLIAERKTRVYDRSDGGTGRGKVDSGEGQKENEPRHDTPLKAWNMLVPVLVLVILIFYMLVKSGEDGTDQDFMDKIENSDSYVALLWGTMAAAILTLIFYWIQPSKDGNVVLPTIPLLKECLLPNRGTSASGNETTANDNDDDETPPSSKARSLMTVLDSTESFLFGMGRIFPALIVLTLAWASGSVMTAVGADRLFSSWIVGGIEAELLPTLSFIISFFMALATGTSWGTMSILFPLITVPTYDVSDGDELIFYATIAGVLSGSVAGDHVSPISDTTVLSSLACDCNLLSHVTTQAPYSMFIVVVSMLLGTLPIGHDAWPNIIGYLLGWLVIGLFVYFYCKPVINVDGSFDILTELWVRLQPAGSAIYELKEDTSLKSSGEDLSQKTSDMTANEGNQQIGKASVIEHLKADPEESEGHESEENTDGEEAKPMMSSGAEDKNVHADIDP
mmetsp:Transcript_17639/g.49954  ORF Transcript_17639/g.49954 Transcript_17639/m.49954 type:complete len:826 (-) Transcript_17639:210-2687(-)|eukprot:CAMPEP_0119565712 /NCGR_PEP_ID=MMETSP1352-20130426/30919_1 /TAXON_ID=265584 /ORGANISM="Stauroneis constricta, Strain CCMP1120" /LENGTH=825 /DNA_ID=CAMNT_0007614693 /DNA_START=130 /DNA_END=2607 /DNA_ORIENTATION=+